MTYLIDDVDYDVNSTVEEIRPNRIKHSRGGIAFVRYMLPEESTLTGINCAMLERVNEFENLQNDWDEEGAIAPSQKVIDLARGIIIHFSAIGQEVFNVVPGPNGEILVDIRNNDKSIEFIFYHNRAKAVLFSGNQAPRQQNFDFNILPDLLKWLNG